MAPKSFVILALCLCIGAGLLIAGCTQQSTSSVPSTTATPAAPANSHTVPTVPTAPTVPAGEAGMANPASVNCVNVGGTVQIKDSAAGQYGMCAFPNGTTCEEWALFRGEGCKAANVTG